VFLHKKIKKMKNWLGIPVLILLFALMLLYWKFNYPSEETIKREIKEFNPNAEFVSADLIFDWEPKRVVTYAVKYKEVPSDEVLLYDLSLKQHWNFKWYWCSDQTERKCK